MLPAVNESPKSESATKENSAQIQSEIIVLREMVREPIVVLHKSR